MKRSQGFTLIEVLIALAIIAIALTALLKSSAQSVSTTKRLKDKNISHWISMQGISMVQLGLIAVKTNEEVTQVTSMLGQRWYWRVKAVPTHIRSVERLEVRVSPHQAGPFGSPLIGFRYLT